MPTWKALPRDQGPETWTWFDENGSILGTIYREGDHWVAKSAAAGRIGEAPSRREATSLLSYDRLTRTAQPSDVFRRRQGSAERVIAIRTLGLAPEPENAGYEDRYAGTTGELLKWAAEKKSPAEIRAEVDQYLRETEPSKRRKR